jgi:hypothetical protein
MESPFDATGFRGSGSVATSRSRNRSEFFAGRYALVSMELLARLCVVNPTLQPARGARSGLVGDRIGRPPQAKFRDRSDLRQSAGRHARHASRMWQPIASAPFDHDLELAVIDGIGTHVLVFACRRILGGWMNAATKERLEVHPTHWRHWGGEADSRPD